MNIYNFYQWVSESGSLFYSAQFADDPSAINQIQNLPGGVYSIMRVDVVDPSTSYETNIYGPQ